MAWNSNKMPHKFELGQIVRLNKPAVSKEKASLDGAYTIIRLMPEDQSGDVHYRLKSSAGERVKRESGLEAVL